MTLDRPLRARLAREIADSLAGTRVRRVHQPQADTLLLNLYRPGRECLLLASAHPRRPRVHLTTRKLPNPPTPPPFCMLARKHLMALPFKDARADPARPVIDVRFGPHAKGVPGDYALLSTEMTGHASTVLLLSERREEKRILGALRALPGARRDLSPGALYVPPRLPGRLDPRTAQPRDLLDTVARLRSGTPGRAKQGGERLLSRVFEGIGRRLAAEALARAGIEPGTVSAGASESEAAAFLAALRDLLEAPCKPLLALDPRGAPLEILSFPLRALDLPTEPIQSVSEALDRLCGAQDLTERTEDFRARILRAISRQTSHRETKLARQRDNLEKARGGDRYRRHADLLLAQGAAGVRGLHSIEVVDAFDPEGRRITIALDPSRTIANNAARLYQHARKARRAIGHLTEVVARGETALRFIAEQRVHAEQASDFETLASIEETLLDVLGPARRQTRERPARERGRGMRIPAGPRRFDVEGWEVLVGRHSRDNDRIVTQLGASNDVWFHARGVPGAHVLLRNQGQGDPPASVLEAAAGIAAHFSRARGEGRTDVIVAWLRHVRKRRGLLPGQVDVIQSRTLRVQPRLPPAR